MYNHQNHQLKSQFEQYGPEGFIIVEHPINLLYAIWHRPFIVRYIKTANFCTRTEDPISEFSRAKINACAGGRDLLQACPRIARALISSNPKARSQEDIPLIHHDNDTWHQRILAGDVGPVITLLLTLLPNLTTLNLWEISEYRREYLDSIMTTIAQDTFAPSTSTPISRVAPLSRLRKLHLHDEVGTDGTPLQTLAPFLALPSILEISGFHLEADYTAYNWPFPEHPISTVETVTLSDTAISAPNMHNFLSTLSNLKYLHYSHSCMNTGAGYLWNGGAFLNAIIAHAGPSLEELHVTIRFTTSFTAIQTFRSLERLKKLHFSAELLIGQADEGKGDEYIKEKYGHSPPDEDRISPLSQSELWGLLPASLEELTVEFQSDPKGWKHFDQVFGD
ncbi:MAG: hypothetical protein Q9196_003657, partial [Gyalolechia fulgens]